MVIITFPDGSEWYQANWAFRQLSEDVVAAFPDNAELKRDLEKAQAFGHLALNAMNPTLASRVMSALKNVAEETIAGNIRGCRTHRPDDERGHAMYVEAIRELLKLLNQQASHVVPESSVRDSSERAKKT